MGSSKASRSASLISNKENVFLKKTGVKESDMGGVTCGNDVVGLSEYVESRQRDGLAVVFHVG